MTATIISLINRQKIGKNLTKLNVKTKKSLKWNKKKWITKLKKRKNKLKKNLKI